MPMRVAKAPTLLADARWRHVWLQMSGAVALRLGVGTGQILANDHVDRVASEHMLSAIDMIQLGARLAGAFALGAIPFAWLMVWLCKGVDVRTVGSGNVGATNASRAFAGKTAQLAVFLAVYLLDAGKGLCAVWLGLSLGMTASVLCAAVGILGHVFTPLLKGKGLSLIHI